MDSLSLIVQLFLLAFFLSISNFAASFGMGFSRMWPVSFRLRIAFIFGFFDFIAPVIGGLIGNVAAAVFGALVGILGVSLLFILGVYLLYDGWLQHGKKRRFGKRNIYHPLLDRVAASMWATAAIAVGTSMDNFIVGFGLGTLQVSFFSIAFVFGLVTFCMTSIGMVAGGAMRDKTEKYIAPIAEKGRVVTGIIFMLIALWKLFEI